MNFSKLFSLFSGLKLFTLFLLCMLSFSVGAKDFYVSVNGKDTNEGTKQNPFATVHKAVAEVEKSVDETASGNYNIYITNGNYQIEKPIVFTSEYFKKNVRVKIEALNPGTVVISGGAKMVNWKKNSEGIWETNVDVKQIGEFRELFVGNKRATRAKWPNEGYLRVRKVGKDRRTNFFFEQGDFPIPEKIDDVELVLLHDWSISRIGVKEINKRKNQLVAVDSIGAKEPPFFNLDNWEKDPRYYLENAPEFLDVDYEWYLDSKKGKLYLKLPDSMDANNEDVVVPVAEKLLEIKGSSESPVKNISFDGISFKHCKWTVPENGYCGVQACFHDARPVKLKWKEVPAAVKLEWAENCNFSNCSFENLGTSGLWISTGSKNSSVSDSRFSDISGNGIMIGEGRERYVNGEVWWKVVPEQIALGNKIENCSVSKCGSQFYGAVGIWCGFVAETIIRNNEISDLPYSGISIGWEWSPQKTPCRENIVDGNHIHNILKILSDGGGIYMLGLQPGSKLVNNHIHDVKINAGRAESNGMFLDEGTTDVVVANNLIYNIAKSPLRFHKATTNLVKDNYLFCTDENPPIRYNNTKEEHIKKVENKVYSEKDAKYSEELKKAIQNRNVKK